MAVPAIRQAMSPVTSAVMLASAAAWAVTIAWASDMGMGAMPGTMRMSLVSFVIMWTFMMAAMMLPSVGPFVGMYSTTVTSHRGPRLAGLGAGYIGVWSAVGIVAFALASVFENLAADRPTAARAVAVVTFAAVGVYQLTPLKFQCLSHCRTPIGHLVHYLSYRGSFRDVRAGASHGWFCLGCCWALMVLMVAFGVMNVIAMIGLAVVIAIEKMWRRGETFARVVGIGCLVYAGALVFMPGLAPGLDPGAVMHMGEMDDMGNMGG